MIPAITTLPFMIYKGAEVCICCDSAKSNPYWYCDTCGPHKHTEPGAKKA